MGNMNNFIHGVGRFFYTAVLLLLPGCTQLTLDWADLSGRGAAARPPVLGAFEGQPPITGAAAWERGRVPALRNALQEHVYGFLPDSTLTRVTERRTLAEDLFGGKAVLEEWDIEALVRFGETDSDPVRFTIVMMLPAWGDRPAPVILMESFCRNHNTIPHPAVSRPDKPSFCDGGGIGALAASFIFGRYNITPPLEEMIDRGYGFVALYPGDYVPDSGEAGLAALRRLAKGHTDEATRWGAIAAWGWGYSRVIDALTDDPRIDQNGIILYGHSRYGKAALIGGAFDDRVDAVISHQSGTGGAALNRAKAGESVGAITDSYPHWFSQTYAAYAGREEEMPVDQHQLLALIAPRPVLLGNARRDVWSDPNGSFRAAQAADPVWELYGKQGLTVESLKTFDPEADIAFHIRPGTHGTTEEDWPVFFEFLEAHFGRVASSRRSDKT